MKLLPILWSEPPAAEDWAALSAAREAIGYTDRVQPCQALQGSPSTVLVIGRVSPSWLQNYYRCIDINDSDDLELALNGALREDERMESYGELLSLWMDAEVKMIGEEEHVEPVGFGT